MPGELGQTSPDSSPRPRPWQDVVAEAEELAQWLAAVSTDSYSRKIYDRIAAFLREAYPVARATAEIPATPEPPTSPKTRSFVLLTSGADAELDALGIAVAVLTDLDRIHDGDIQAILAYLNERFGKGGR